MSEPFVLFLSPSKASRGKCSKTLANETRVLVLKMVPFPICLVLFNTKLLSLFLLLLQCYYYNVYYYYHVYHIIIIIIIIIIISSYDHNCNIIILFLIIQSLSVLTVWFL